MEGHEDTADTSVYVFYYIFILQIFCGGGSPWLNWRGVLLSFPEFVLSLEAQVISIRYNIVHL